MGEYKLLGACMVILCGVLLGGALNRAASSALHRTEAWIRLLRFACLQIECFSLPVREILGRADQGLLSECGFHGAERPERFHELLSRCEIADEETWGVLRDFSESFGRGYREEQIRECNYYIGLLEARRETLASRLGGKRKLNTTLSLSGALALVIFFL